MPACATRTAAAPSSRWRKQILRIEAKTDYARGITCNVGLISGGTGVNVVSAECTAEVDLRVPSQQLAEEMTHWFLGPRADRQRRRGDGRAAA